MLPAETGRARLGTGKGSTGRLVPWPSLAPAALACGSIDASGKQDDNVERGLDAALNLWHDWSVRAELANAVEAPHH